PEAPPGRGQAQLHHILHRLAHLVVEVGRLQKAAPFVQHHRIGGVGLHDKVFHSRVPPLGVSWHKCPRMISYPLVNASRIATRYFRWRSMVFLSTPEPRTRSRMGSRPVRSSLSSRMGLARAQSSTARQAARVRSCRGQLSATSEKPMPNEASCRPNSAISARVASRRS